MFPPLAFPRALKIQHPSHLSSSGRTPWRPFFSFTPLHNHYTGPRLIPPFFGPPFAPPPSALVPSRATLLLKALPYHYYFPFTLLLPPPTDPSTPSLSRRHPAHPLSPPLTLLSLPFRCIVWPSSHFGMRNAFAAPSTVDLSLPRLARCSSRTFSAMRTSRTILCHPHTSLRTTTSSSTARMPSPLQLVPRSPQRLSSPPALRSHVSHRHSQCLPSAH